MRKIVSCEDTGETYNSVESMLKDVLDGLLKGDIDRDVSGILLLLDRKDGYIVQVVWAGLQVHEKVELLNIAAHVSRQELS